MKTEERNEVGRKKERKNGSYYFKQNAESFVVSRVIDVIEKKGLFFLFNKYHIENNTI